MLWYIFEAIFDIFLPINGVKIDFLFNFFGQSIFLKIITVALVTYYIIYVITNPKQAYEKL
jgi:hypothetical protein